METECRDGGNFAAMDGMRCKVMYGADGMVCA